MYPRLVTLGPITIPTYGALLACAVIAAILLAVALARRVHLNPDRIWTLCLLTVATAIVFDKLLRLAFSSQALMRWPLLWMSLSILQSAGLSIVVAVAIGFAYAWRVRLPLLRTFDVLAPAISLGTGIACIGDLAAGRNFGLPTNAAWGLVFTSRLAQRNTGVPLGVPLYPTQIAESAAFLLISTLLIWLLRRKHQNGEIFSAWLFLYGTARFYLEFYRSLQSPFIPEAFHGAITPGQLLGILMVLASGVFWSVTSSRQELTPHAS